MRLRVTALLLAMGLFPASSWGQAAAEYGLAAGKSATATSGAASVLNKANRRLADAIGQKANAATNVRSQPSTLKSSRTAARTHASTATQVSAANAGTTTPSTSALVIETGKGTIMLGGRSAAPQDTQAGAPVNKPKTDRPAQKRYDSVISLPASN